MIGILRATIDHLEPLSKLFDGYRSFYGQPADQRAARRFVKERLKRADSVIFLFILFDVALLLRLLAHV